MASKSRRRARSICCSLLRMRGFLEDADAVIAPDNVTISMFSATLPIKTKEGAEKQTSKQTNKQNKQTKKQSKQNKQTQANKQADKRAHHFVSASNYVSYYISLQNNESIYSKSQSLHFPRSSPDTWNARKPTSYGSNPPVM